MTGLGLRRNPVSLVFSRGLRASAWYLFSYLFTGTVFLAVVVCASLIASTLSLTIAGLPLLAVAAGVIRWCADAERARLRIMSANPVRGRYRAVTGRAWLARLKSRWTDPALWRDLAYLSALSPCCSPLTSRPSAPGWRLWPGSRLPPGTRRSGAAASGTAAELPAKASSSAASRTAPTAPAPPGSPSTPCPAP